MTRCWAVGAAVGLAVVALAALAAVLVIGTDISARRAPSALEARFARAVRQWAIPADAREARNPLPAGPQALVEGLAHFADHCASCHANDGSGRTALGRSLYPRAPDLRGSATRELTDGELFYIIENGVRLTGMPAWGGPETAEGSWQLVHFIRHLPDLTAEEEARMETLNPRSPDEWRALQEEDAFLGGDAPVKRGVEHRSHGH